jgi:hypothetical protein
VQDSGSQRIDIGRKALHGAGTLVADGHEAGCVLSIDVLANSGVEPDGACAPRVNAIASTDDP